MNITVYLGANEGNDPRLAQAVRELGRWIGESGNALIYGGSACGLMGELAKSVLDAGGKATGVEPQFFVDQGLLYDDLTELFVTKDMTERKAKMIELGDAFIASPAAPARWKKSPRSCQKFPSSSWTHPASSTT